MATVLGDIEVYDGFDVSKVPKKLLGHAGAVLDFCQSPYVFYFLENMQWRQYCFFSDGKLLLTVSDDQTAKVFEMPTQEWFQSWASSEIISVEERYWNPE